MTLKCWYIDNLSINNLYCKQIQETYAYCNLQYMLGRHSVGCKLHTFRPIVYFLVRANSMMNAHRWNRPFGSCALRNNA